MGNPAPIRNPIGRGDSTRRIDGTNENNSANPYGSPVKIPENAVIKPKKTKAGYYHMQYEWTDTDGYYYKARWHTKTPNAPLEQRDVWVIERGIKGIGYGKSQRNGFSEILVAPNMWVDWDIWKDALNGRKYGNITKELEEILEYGHWKT